MYKGSILMYLVHSLLYSLVYRENWWKRQEEEQLVHELSYLSYKQTSSNVMLDMSLNKAGSYHVGHGPHNVRTVKHILSTQFQTRYTKTVGPSNVTQTVGL